MKGSRSGLRLEIKIQEKCRPARKTIPQQSCSCTACSQDCKEKRRKQRETRCQRLNVQDTGTLGDDAQSRWDSLSNVWKGIEWLDAGIEPQALPSQPLC